MQNYFKLYPDIRHTTGNRSHRQDHDLPGCRGATLSGPFILPFIAKVPGKTPKAHQQLLDRLTTGPSWSRGSRGFQTQGSPPAHAWAGLLVRPLYHRGVLLDLEDDCRFFISGDEGDIAYGSCCGDPRQVCRRLPARQGQAIRPWVPTTPSGALALLGHRRRHGLRAGAPGTTAWAKPI